MRHADRQAASESQPRDHTLDEDQDQDQNDRRDVDPAQVGHEVTDRAQCGLRDSPQEIRNGGNELVPGIDDIEGDQPAQDGRSDQQPDVKLDGNEDNIGEGSKNGAHIMSGVRETELTDTADRFRIWPKLLSAAGVTRKAPMPRLTARMAAT